MNLTILSLATYRTTRAITQDDIFVPLQTKIQASPLPGKLKTLASCPHCLAPYAALTFLALHHRYPRTTTVLTTILAAAAVSSLLHDAADRLQAPAHTNPTTPPPSTPQPAPAPAFHTNV